VFFKKEELSMCSGCQRKVGASLVKGVVKGGTQQSILESLPNWDETWRPVRPAIMRLIQIQPNCK
jgi:hypothetical protein